MHLADFSYTERLTQDVAVLVIFAAYYFSTARKEHMSSIKRWVFGLTMLSLVGWIIFDIMAMKVKYEEWRDPEAKCMPKSHALYSDDNKSMLTGIKYYLNVVWTSHSSALFLLLVYLENLAKPYKISLGTSREYMMYKVWAPVSFIAYPLVQTLFDYVFTSVRNHTLLGSVTPQLANHAEVGFVAIMLYRANRKLTRLAWSSAWKHCSSVSQSISILRFQISCIRLLVAFLLLDVVGLATINIDVVVMVFADGSGAVYKSAFASDVLISLFSIGLTGSHLAILFILFPPVYLLDVPRRTSTVVHSRRPAKLMRPSSDSLNSDWGKSTNGNSTMVVARATSATARASSARRSSDLVASLSAHNLSAIPSSCELDSSFVRVSSGASQPARRNSNVGASEHATVTVDVEVMDRACEAEAQGARSVDETALERVPTEGTDSTEDSVVLDMPDDVPPPTDGRASEEAA